MNKTMSKKKTGTKVSGIKKQGFPNVGDLPEKDKLIERVLTKLAKMPEKTLVNYGHQLEDMVMKCGFNYEDCL